jgi:hypothetical protein
MSFVAEDFELALVEDAGDLREALPLGACFHSVEPENCAHAAAKLRLVTLRSQDFAPRIQTCLGTRVEVGVAFDVPQSCRDLQDLQPRDP